MFPQKFVIMVGIMVGIKYRRHAAPSRRPVTSRRRAVAVLPSQPHGLSRYYSKQARLALRVPPSVTWLTVYRWLHIEGVPCHK